MPSGAIADGVELRQQQWPTTVAWARIYGVLLVVALAPLAFFEMPAMLDYPNHLARMHLLAAGDRHPALQAFYEIAWGFYPNLAMDLLVPALAGWLGVELATKAFLVLSLALVLTGAAALERAVKGRFGIGAFVVLLFAWNAIFVMGFVNFIFGLGVCLWGLAIWVALRERGIIPRAILHSLFVPGLFVAHLYALGTYGLVLGVLELHRLRTRRTPPARAATDLLVLGLPFLVLVAVFLSNPVRTGNAGQFAWVFAVKWRAFLTLIGAYYPIVAALKTAALVLLVAWLWSRKSLALQPAGLWVGGALALTYLLMPTVFLDGYAADVRILVAAAFILPAWLTWDRRDRPGGTLAALLCGAIFAANLAGVVWFWGDLQKDYREMRASFARLDPDSKVLVVWAENSRALDLAWPEQVVPRVRDWAGNALVHFPTLAAADAGALVPSFFAVPGQQVVKVRPAYREIAPPGGGDPVSIRALLEPGRPAAAGLGERAYWRNWMQDFDYLYVLLPEDGANPLPAALDPLLSGRRFMLYRIRRQG